MPGYEVDKDLFPFKVPGVTGDGLTHGTGRRARRRPKWAWNWSMACPIRSRSPGPARSLPAAASDGQPARQTLHERGRDANVTFTPMPSPNRRTGSGYCYSTRPFSRTCSATSTPAIASFHKPRFEDAPAVIEAYLESGRGNFYRATSIEDLCAQTGADPEGLTATIETIIVLAPRDMTSSSTQPQRYLRPLTGGTWVCGATFSKRLWQRWRIKINERPR